MLGIAAAGAAVSMGTAQAGTLTTLYSFTGFSDGGTPMAGLLYDGGALYGTAQIGGAIDTEACPRGCGVVFKVDAKKGTESVVYAFSGGTADGRVSRGRAYFSGRSALRDDCPGRPVDLRGSRLRNGVLGEP
jgi:uncharacterized repeat protein (TIGR03803 family)